MRRLKELRGLRELRGLGRLKYKWKFPCLMLDMNSLRLALDMLCVRDLGFCSSSSSPSSANPCRLRAKRLRVRI